MKRIFEFGLFILCVTFWVACSRTPKGVISEKKMRNVLVDMHLAEAIINQNPQEYNNLDNRKAVYQSVFDKYNIEEAEYDSSLVWYGKNLDLYMRIYNLALSDVKKRIDAMGDIKPEAMSTDLDSVNIWMYDKYYEFSPLSLTNTLIFDFKPANQYTSGSSFIFSFNIWGITSDNQSIELRLRADQNDTIITIKNTIADNGYKEILLKTHPTKRVKRIYGYLRLNEERKPYYHKIYLDDIQLIKFKYGAAYIEKLDSVELKKEPS